MSTNANETVAAAAPENVENITESFKDVSISGEAAASAEGRRLFIGNLAYSTTEEQLREFFTGFSIESTSIPISPRTGNAVGYAFVDLTSAEDVERAIEELSGKDLLDRKVSVQLARKNGAGGRRGGGGGGSEGENGAAGDGQQSHQEGGRKHRSGGRGRGRRWRGGMRNRQSRENGATSADEEKASPTNVPGQVLPLTELSSGTPPASTEDAAPHTEGEGSDNTKNTNTRHGNHGGYKPKKKRGPPENGVPSSTKVMVANLPYELSEEKLLELFAPYQPESAKIALRPIPRFMVRKLQERGEPRKGRGFGFVTLASEEMQKKAVEEMDGKTIDGREIAVKVAIDTPKVESEDAENAEGGNKAGNSESGGEAENTADASAEAADTPAVETA